MIEKNGLAMFLENLLLQKSRTHTQSFHRRMNVIGIRKLHLNIY